jgi:preprotein translocase subunit SecB
MSFDEFRIVKISFSLNKKFKRKSKGVPINPIIAVGHRYNKTKATIFLKVSLVEANCPFSFDIEGEGKFTFSENINTKMADQFLKINCPAIIFPYIRETVADITRRSGYPPLHLPPVNFIELAKEKQEI